MAIEIFLNGESREVPGSMNVVQFLDFFSLPKDRIAVERNRSIVPKTDWERVNVTTGDKLEVVHFVGGGSPATADDPLTIAGRRFTSRLIVGTGKYPSNEVMAEADGETDQVERSRLAEAAILAFRRFLSNEGVNVEDLYLASTRVGELYLMMGNQASAIDAFLSSLKIIPD